MSLKEPTAKMSKSHADPRSRVHINDSKEDIATKIRFALTDSLAGITYEPEKRPGIANLLSIMSYLDDQVRSCEELARVYKDLSMREFKDEVVSTIDSALGSIRERYTHLMTDTQSGYVEEVARNGAGSARMVAERTMSTIRRAVGLS